MSRRQEGTCNECKEPSLPDRKYCEPHLIRRREYMRTYTERHREKLNTTKREAYRSKPFDPAIRDINLRKKFGIGLDEYEEMLAAQGGVCAICNNVETVKSNRGYIKALAVDHCHETGKVRGLLCNNCNRAIGLLKDSPDLLLAALAHLNGEIA